VPIRFGRKLRRVIDAEVRLNELESALAAATCIADCWDAIRSSSKHFGFAGVRLSAGETVLEHFAAEVTDRLWQLRIPINETDYINFYRPYNSTVNPVILSAFVSTIERTVRTCPALTQHTTAAAALSATGFEELAKSEHHLDDFVSVTPDETVVREHTDPHTAAVPIHS